jgi:Homeodomain-like domain
VAGKEIAVKKYVVRLSAEERAQLDELISKGKRSAQLLTKARILLKADVSDAGEGWSDSRIAAALDTSIANIERTRRQLVEEGFEAVLTRKYNPNSARPRIFDGAAEAKLIALTLSPAPEGFARWSLRLLEEKVVELHIVERASDNTIGRTLKKHSQTPPQAAMGDSAGRQRSLCRQHGRRAGGLSEAARSAASARVSRRDLQAADR